VAITSEVAVRTDGRVARGIRAREQIASSLIALLEDGVLQPTAREVAGRAGVSQRLVFHHFADMEAVLESAVAIQAERHWRRLETVPRGDLQARVRATVRDRAELFEAIAPVRRAANRVKHDSETLTHYLETARRALRGQLRQVFSAELESESLVLPAVEQREILDALEVATSFEAWDHLRQDLGRSKEAARRVVERLVIGILGEAT
jgi:TetR/AcrR family transcriptional regulator, regulator of autoinduction and epiphytic fitness